MRTDYFFDSKGAGRIHASRWVPEGEPKAVVQIIHGIAEYAERYEDFANYLNTLGYVVVAEDHMGHGHSMETTGHKGYFDGGWFTAVEDSYTLLEMTRRDYPDIPYVLFGHSMGSFMTRTILCRHPDSGISAAVICGTGWQPRQILPGAIKVCEAVCRRVGERNPSEWLQNLVFGSYNKRVEHPRTPCDWLSRDARSVDAYISHPFCGFTASAGLLRELLKGIRYVEEPKNLAAMDKKLPVFFIAGGDDPVGSYGKGVLRTAEEFKKAGVEDVKCKLYPLGRHEILNEINKEEVYQDVSGWIGSKLENAD